MKVRLLGAGDPYCRHPLVSASILIQTERSTVVIGCGPNVPAKLEAVGVHADKVDIWIALNTRPHQIGGLEEIAAIAHRRGNTPIVAAPSPVVAHARDTLTGSIGKEGLKLINFKSTMRIHIEEDHYEEIIRFEPVYLAGHTDRAYGVLLEHAELFISGDTEFNEELIDRMYGRTQCILHCVQLDSSPTPGSAQCAKLSELQSLPLYIQMRTWLYAYPNAYLHHEAPLPMLFMPQGHTIYDSSRREKMINKEKFIEDDARRVLGNERVKADS